MPTLRLTKRPSASADPIRFVPASDWSAVGRRGHGVQFYATDDHLIDLLARYIGTALVTCEVGFILATKKHRLALEKRLKACGLDVAVARRQGRYIAPEATSTLRKFMSHGWPDEDRFKNFIGGLIDRIAGPATGQPRRIYAFCELVAVLCAQGRADAAIRIEELWNDLARSRSFSLLCAYPMRGFTAGHAAPFVRICAQHSHVFPAMGHALGNLTA
jgi:hypothetical protein